MLPVFAGSATRLLEYAAEDRKSYRAEITFGVKTDTGDDSGTVTERSSLPACSKEDFSGAAGRIYRQAKSSCRQIVFGLKTLTGSLFTSWHARA